MSAVLLPLPPGEGRGEGPPRAEEPSAKYLTQLEPALIRHFDLLVTSPGGVAKLREFILTLAVQGKLVPQDPSDEPASVLMQRISADKDKLAAEGAIRRDKPLAPITADDEPFELPRGWSWARLGDVAWPQAGFAFKSTHFNEAGEGLPLIRIRDVGEDDPATYFSGDYRKEFLVTRGDWLVSMDGEFRVREWRGPAALLNQRVTRLIFYSESFEQGFAAVALQRELTKLQGQKAYTTVDHLSGGQIAESVIAVPPSCEQSRIVKRIEELMRLCDALETKGRLDTSQHTQLVGTLLATLIDSETPEALAANWQRVAAHFDLLLDRPAAVDSLEQTILQLAVRGLLVEQDPSDSPAKTLFGSSNTDNSSGEVLLPAGWAACRLGDLCTISGGSTPSKANDRFWNGDIPWVSPKDMKVDRIRNSIDHVSKQALDETNLAIIPAGSLLFVVRGMILAHSFPVAVTEVPVTINQDMKALTPYSPGLATYLALVCLGFKPEILAMVQRSTHGTCKLESSKVFDWRFPLPPLAEQARIVARVNSLRRLCADLRQRLAAAQTTQARLAEALVASATD